MHGFYIKGYEMIILIGKIAKFDSKIVQKFESYSKSDTEYPIFHEKAEA
jgi:hypothetical protein